MNKMEQIQAKIDKGETISEDDVNYLHSDEEETAQDTRVIPQEVEDAD